MNVPQLNLAANFAALRDELLAEIAAVCESGQYVLGEKVAAFEAALADYCGAPFALGVSSGTDALLLAMMALDIGRGDEVIVPSFTFFATAGCVSRLGATPVFCDVRADSFNIDVDAIEPLITPRTRAIIPVHLYGGMADMRAVERIAKRHNLRVIEDAAQAIGAREAGSDRRAAGSIGELGCMSFYPTKNLAAIGDAGGLLVRDEQLFEKTRMLRLHGEKPKYHHRLIGGNFRIDALQAAILHVKLRRLDEWTDQRRAAAGRYREFFAEAHIDESSVTLPADPESRHVYHQFVIRAARRDELMEHLRRRGVGSAIYYPVPLHLQDCFADLGYKPGDLPVSEAVAADVLALPMYPELTADQQRHAVREVAAFYGHGG
jgi:dTDP-4-amino-4,6-dideoxygalactose transaminase